MRFEAETEPLAFAERFLELHGAAVEKRESTLEALLPEALSALLETPEHIFISADSESGADSDRRYSIAYGTPLLDRMIGGALSKIPLAGCRLEFDYVKSGGFHRLLDEQMTFYGAAASIETVAEVFANYLLLIVRYTAQSDEQKEGLLPMVFNADTGSFVPEMTQALDAAQCQAVYAPPEKDALRNIARLGEAVEQTARRLVEEELVSFRLSMARRFKRDLANLVEYYIGLEQEMLKALEKPGLSDNARRDRQSKIDGLPSELANKRDDLLKKYSVKVRLKPAAAMQIRTPARRIICRLSIGRQTRQFFLTYNPVTRRIDPPVCSRCHSPIFHIHFEGALEALCFDCRGGTSAQGRKRT